MWALWSTSKHSNLVLSTCQKRGVITGKATSQGTAEYFKRHKNMPYRERPRTGGLKISRGGFGTYRVGQGEDIHEHKLAMQLALTNGINIIDTSANSANGGAEVLVGEVLQQLLEDKKVKREEIVIMSKAGIVQGSSMEEAQKKKEAGEPWEEMDIIMEEILWHCIHPSYIEDQITGSLGRLNLDTIDFFLIQNPEHYYDRHARMGTGDPEFNRRIEAAFTHLEKEVKRGRIQHYGVSSDLTLPKNDPKNVSLDLLLHIAANVGDGFGVIQFPFNLFESGAFLQRNNYNSTQTVLQLAEAAGLMSFANRSLNAIADGRVLFRMAQPQFPKKPSQEDIEGVKQALNYAIHLEKTYPGTDPNHVLVKEKVLPPFEELSWAQLIAQNSQTLDYYQFQEAVKHQIEPVVDKHLQFLQTVDGMQDWAMNYRRALNKCLDLWQGILAWNRHFDLTKFEEGLNIALPSFCHYPTLPQKVHQVLLSTPLDCILLGCKQQKYVQEALQVLGENTEDRKVDLYKSELENVFDFTMDQGKYIADRLKPKTQEQNN